MRSHAALVYQLKRPLTGLPENLRLKNHEWGTLFAITGEHSCAQIASLLGLDPAERERTFSRLLACGLIEERPLGYGEYLRAVASWRDEESRSLEAYLRGGAAMPQGAAPAAAKKPGMPAGVVAAPLPPIARTPPRPPAPQVVTADSDLNITRALPTVTRQQALGPAAGEAPVFLPLDNPPPATPTTTGIATTTGTTTPTAAPARGALSLKALMGHILRRASDPQSGQLDVYRVFIRVHSKLLQRNGITTLRFEDDRLIDDRELQSALVASFEKALGVPCPPEVFV